MSTNNPIMDAVQKSLGSLTGGRGINKVDEHSAAPVGGLNLSSKARMGDGGLVTSIKGSGYLSTDDQPEGTSLNPQAQLGLFQKIRRTAGWARFVSFRPVSENSGTLDLWSDEGFKMVATNSNGPRNNIPLHKPDLSSREFRTSTVSGAFGLRLKALKAAAKAGQNVNQLVQRGIAAGIANCFMDIGVNGDTDLPSDTDDNRMRRSLDGWFKKIRSEGTHYTSLDDGFRYHNEIWPALIEQIGDQYRSDPGLAWGIPDKLGTKWLSELTAVGGTMSNGGPHPSVINDFGAALLNAMGNGAKPLGKESVVMPQIGTTQYGTEGYAGMAPTSVADNGDGTLTINVNTLAGSGTDRSSTGADGQRYITVGNSDTGIEETIAVAYSAPNNTITTTSVLGQTNVSTTAGDYYVKWADMTSMFLGVFRYLVMIVQNGIRIYTVFYPKDEVIAVIVHADIDCMVVDYDAVALVDSIISPRFSVIPA